MRTIIKKTRRETNLADVDMTVVTASVRINFAEEPTCSLAPLSTFSCDVSLKVTTPEEEIPREEEESTVVMH